MKTHKRKSDAEVGLNHVQQMRHHLNESFVKANMPFHFDSRVEHPTKERNTHELTQLNTPENRTTSVPDSVGVGYDVRLKGYDDKTSSVKFHFKPSTDELFIKGPTPKYAKKPGGYGDQSIPANFERRKKWFEQYLRRCIDDDVYILFFEKDKDLNVTLRISRVYSIRKILGDMVFGKDKDWWIRSNNTNLNRIILNKPKDIEYVRCNRKRRALFDSAPSRLEQMAMIYNKKFKINKDEKNRPTKST